MSLGRHWRGIGPPDVVSVDDPSPNKDAMAWHTYFWDPWFLVWGLHPTAALWRSKSQQASAASFPIREPSIR
jgi:hypothetical protein